MANNKYISTKEAVRLTGLSIKEIYDLIHNGKLPAHKAPKSGWRISLQDLTTLGLIQEETLYTTKVAKSEEDQIENIISYVADDEHYTEEDVKSYIEFCDWQSENHRPQNINYYAWYLFVVLVHKIKAKGIESVLMREDVFGVKQCKERYYETERKFLAVETKYGTIVVYSKDEIKYRD